MITNIDEASALGLIYENIAERLRRKDRRFLGFSLRDVTGILGMGSFESCLLCQGVGRRESRSIQESQLPDCEECIHSLTATMDPLEVSPCTQQKTYRDLMLSLPMSTSIEGYWEEFADAFEKRSEFLFSLVVQARAKEEKSDH